MSSLDVASMYTDLIPRGIVGVGEQRTEEEIRDPQMMRTLLANDRTYLAWLRTALSLVAAGVAVAKLLPPLELLGGRRVLGTLIVGLGAATGMLAYLRWQTNDRMIRAGEGLARGGGQHAMAAIIGLVVAVGFVVVIAGTS